MVAVALEVALTVPMVNMNIQILVINVPIVGHHLSGVVHTAHLASINMNLGKVNVVIVDHLHMGAVHIVHQENTNINWLLNSSL